MAYSLGKDYEEFIIDIEKKFKSKEDVEYLKEKLPLLIKPIFNGVDKMNNLAKKNEEEMKNFRQVQSKLESKIDYIEKVVSNIENDIYAEDGFDFEIMCPYCNYDFVLDIDENRKEIKCPNCNNLIELDWSGGDELDNFEGCNGGCETCPGCDNNEDDM